MHSFSTSSLNPKTSSPIRRPIRCCNQYNKAELRECFSSPIISINIRTGEIIEECIDDRLFTPSYLKEEGKRK